MQLNLFMNIEFVEYGFFVKMDSEQRFFLYAVTDGI